MSDLILKCDNLHKKFGKKEILKGVSVEVNKGDILGFIGPNGAGKSTLIRHLTGVYDIEKNFTKAIEKVGAIVENPDLYMYLTGYENLKLVANLYPSVKKERIDEVIKLVGLSNRIFDKVSKYSLGMRQRLGIAQAILHKPNLLILDEPTNGLDPEGIKEIRELLKELAEKEGMAVFISSHNLAELETFCNKVCIIKNGVVVETSRIDEVKRSVENECYIIEVENTNSISSIIKEKIEILDSNQFKINTERENIPKLIHELVLRNVKIYSVRKEEMSLEDAFLKKTGGNIIE